MTAAPLRLFVCAAAALAAVPAPAAAQGVPFVEASGEYSPVEIGTADLTWHLGRLSAGWLDEGQAGWIAAGERHQRGAAVDWTGTATGFRRAGDWTMTGTAGVTARPEFLYRYSLEGELARRIVGTLVLHGGYRHLAFPHADVGIAQPAASVYFPRGELQARAFLVRNLTLERSSRPLLVRGTVNVNPRVTLGGGAAVGTRIFDVAALGAPDADGWVGFRLRALRARADIGVRRRRRAHPRRPVLLAANAFAGGAADVQVIPADTLDGLLTLVAAIWIALSVTIVVDRNRYDRRMRCATALQTRLRLAPCSDRCSTPATRPPCSGAFASLGGWARPSGCRGSGS